MKRNPKTELAAQKGGWVERAPPGYSSLAAYECQRNCCGLRADPLRDHDVDERGAAVFHRLGEGDLQVLRVLDKEAFAAGACGAFLALKTAGGVNEATKASAATASASEEPAGSAGPSALARQFDPSVRRDGQRVGLNLAYTINLYLPPSSDPEVFNAIFKAFKEHLLEP